MLRHVLVVAAALVGASGSARAEPAAATMYVNPQCGCCQGHANYLRANAFKITVKETRDMSLIRRQHGVPDNLEGCHVLLIDGYVVEGHVPAAPIRKLLDERPQIKGISLPGMPDGSPGMTGRKSEPFKIYEITEGEPKIFAVE